MFGFNILTLNVSGLNNIRRTRVKNILKQLAIHIVCLQETHLKREEEKDLKQIFRGHIYNASSGAHTKEVMLGIMTKIP